MSRNKHLATIAIFFIGLLFVQAFVINTLLDFLFADTYWQIVLLISALFAAGSIYVYYLSHSTSNETIDQFYNFVGLWWGLLFNLFFGSLLYWVILVFSGSIWYAMLPLVASFFVFWYGLCLAKKIKTKQLEIKVPHLPDSWNGKKIAFISDLHLGKTLGRNFLANIVSILNSEDIELLLIGGDLFDSTHADWQMILEPLIDLNVKDHIYYVTGNHEYYVNNFETELKPHLEALNIHLLQSAKVDLGGLEIGGIYHALSDLFFDFKKEYAKLGFSPNVSSILLYHEPVPTHSEYAMKHHTDLQLSGHTHVGQMTPYNILAWLHYWNYYYGLYEHPETGTMQYTSSGTGTWGPPVRTSAAPEVVIITLKQ